MLRDRRRRNLEQARSPSIRPPPEIVLQPPPSSVSISPSGPASPPTGSSTRVRRIASNTSWMFSATGSPVLSPRSDHSSGAGGSGSKAGLGSNSSGGPRDANTGETLGPYPPGLGAAGDRQKTDAVLSTSSPLRSESATTDREADRRHRPRRRLRRQGGRRCGRPPDRGSPADRRRWAPAAPAPTALRCRRRRRTRHRVRPGDNERSKSVDHRTVART